MTDKTAGMGVAPALKPYQIAEAERSARAIVEGPFHAGARAMKEAVTTRLKELERYCAAAPIVADVPLPDFVSPDPKPESGWSWWASRNEEWFTVGPCSTREEAIADARDEFEGDGFHVLEAAQGAVRLRADRLIDDQYFEADDDFDFDNQEPDRIGGADVIATADAELQALLDGWVARWRHTFVAPNLFRGTRNSEYVAGQCVDCGTDCGDNCPADPDYDPEGSAA